jgi:hypothetical protein
MYGRGSTGQPGMKPESAGGAQASGERPMEHKSIDFVGYFSLILTAVSVLGVAALTFGPWGAQPSGGTAYAILTISCAAFGMLSMMAINVAKILLTQADEIAALQQQLSEQRSRA